MKKFTFFTAIFVCFFSVGFFCVAPWIFSGCANMPTTVVNTVQQVAFRAAARHIGYEVSKAYPEEVERLGNIGADYLTTGDIKILSAFKKELLALVDGNPLLQADLDDLVSMMGIDMVTFKLKDVPNIRSAISAFLYGVNMGVAEVEGVQS